MQQVRCEVRGVFVAINDAATVPVVVLTDRAGRRLPIFVGLWEAVSINSAQNKEVPPRPFTHDLFLDLMGKVCNLRPSALISTVSKKGCTTRSSCFPPGAGTECLDCRPSDGIAVALRASAPVFVDEGLLAAAGQEESISSMVEISTFLQK